MEQKPGRGSTLGSATLTLESTAPTGVADLDLRDVERALAGDAGAFERIYRRHIARIHTLCRRMMSPEEADDVAQDVFIRAWEKLSLFRGDSAFGTWLYRLAVNVILGRRQTHATYRNRFQAGDDEEGELTMPARSIRPDLRVDFEAAIGTLPRGARDVFLLHDVQGYTHEEIAEMLEVSAGTSKSQLHRARMSLRQYLR
jgi:RNA polymerase sigma-70 factor, ECF subfamily